MSVVFDSLADDKVAGLLHKGAVGVLPTDTVYGLVGCADNPDAVNRLYDLKNRENKPGTVIAANIEQLVTIGIKKRYLKAVEQFWPGPISVIVPYTVNHDSLRLDLGIGTIAVRVTADDKLRQLLRKTGPLLTTSANCPGEPTANTMQEAQKIFGEKVDFYINGGNLKDRQPSTIIRIVDDAIEVLRQGAGKISKSGSINR